MSPEPHPPSPSSELERLLAGDEATFAVFARAHHPVLVRFAAARLGPSSSAVDEVVQEAWLLFLESLPRFEGRSALRTFLIGILVNVIRNRARRDARTVPFSALATDDEEPPVSPDRFLGPGDPWEGHWAAPPPVWKIEPGDRAAVQAALETALAALPDAQREVITLRDVLGWDAEEVCSALGITDTHQRVLLHRARSKMRASLEKRFGQ